MIDHPDQPTPQGDSSARQRLQTGALVIIAAAVILFLLVQARFMLTSLAVAIIVFSLTSDAISYISRLKVGPLRIPNWLASLAAVLLISTGLFMLSSLVLSQVNTVLSTTLTYTERAPGAVADLFAWMGPEVETAIQNAMGSIDVSGYLRTVAGQAGGLMQGTVLVILFVGFLFAERLWFDVKLTSLMGGDAARAQQAQRIIGAIMGRVNYYLLVKTVVSAITGLMAYGVSVLVGLELAVAIGVLTFILNYIPNIGSIVATVLAVLVAHVQLGEPGPTLAYFFALFVIQFINGNIIDPWLMGRTLRLSTFGIIVSLAFWGAVWGIAGMFLSVPIMVAVMIVASHVPGLRPVAVLLSREGLPDEATAPLLRKSAPAE
ncbi:AI-2E family transporter [Roseicyclus marinus]|uniref:AI-2E family transporter n=1 Tax=Roseicyclus marinus TaxID=2161673 RepID=UPI002410999F|nr:AI-2E family transporter [Roseicyclus marinus]MDG3041312.1 AI-2E family transporter [Roseicyclus marinus]